MLSLEEIRNWADAITTGSTLKLLKFCHTPSKRLGRTVAQILFVEGGNEYRVWVYPELNMMYVDVLHEGLEGDAKLFRGPVTRCSLECISLILRRSQS
jgi:hypothetical protein